MIVKSVGQMPIVLLAVLGRGAGQVEGNCAVTFGRSASVLNSHAYCRTIIDWGITG